MIYIGIDGGRTFGCAAWNHAEQRFISMETTDRRGAVAFVYRITDEHIAAYGRPALIVEDPEQNKPVFVRPKIGRKEILVMMKIAQDVGRVKERTICFIEDMEAEGYCVIRVRPSTSTGTKMRADAFRRRTGWAFRTSEHSRDAAMLVWKR